MTTETPGPSDAAVRPPVDPGANSDPRPLTAARLIADSHGAARAAVTAGVGQLPRLDEVIADAQRALTQALAILDREFDPASAPTVPVWPEISDQIFVHNVHLQGARLFTENALLNLAKIDDLSDES